MFQILFYPINNFFHVLNNNNYLRVFHMLTTDTLTYFVAKRSQLVDVFGSKTAQNINIYDRKNVTVTTM